MYAYLLVDDRAETGLALDDGVGDTHLAAEGGEEDDELNGVNIVGDEDESGLLGLDEGDNVVETVLDDVGLLADVLLLLALGDGGGLLGKTLLLVGLGLRAVLVEELEGLGGGVAVKNVLELGDRRRDLQAHVQDLALALQADVGGPFDEAGQVATGLDVLANTEVLRAALNERVLHGALGSCRARRHCRGIVLSLLTLAFFLFTPALVWGNGAGAAFLVPALGGYH
jgi:hypothetical protein